LVFEIAKVIRIFSLKNEKVKEKCHIEYTPKAGLDVESILVLGTTTGLTLPFFITDTFALGIMFIVILISLFC